MDIGGEQKLVALESSDILEPEKTLGQYLQLARQKAGLTQQQLCQKAGLSYSTLTKIERGAIKSPSVFTIQQLASVLETSLDGLLGLTSPVTSTVNLNKQKSKNGISFVFFDINGCLVRFFHRAFSMIANDTGASPDIIESTFWHYNDMVCKGSMNLLEFNDVYAKRLGVRSIDWRSYYMNSIDPIQEMHQLVEWASRLYKVGLLSNIMPGFIDEMMIKNLIPNIKYDVIVDSSVEGFIKPESKIYEIAQERAGCSAQEILLIDDSRTNLMNPEHMGWHVLWFDDYNPQESVKRIQTTLEP